MRFAVTVTDRYIDVFKTFVQRGWTPVRVFTTPVDNRIHRNTAVLDFARQLKVPVQISRLTEENLRELADHGCEALVLAAGALAIGVRTCRMPSIFTLRRCRWEGGRIRRLRQSSGSARPGE